MNTVFVLGAGFSKRHGGPLLGEMLDEKSAENQVAVGSLWETPQYGAIRRVLKRLPTHDRNLEGVFNYLANQSFYGGRIGNYSPKTLIDFLTLYIAELIESRASALPYEPRFDEVYKQFTDVVLPDEPSAIITFNYDLIGENIINAGYGGLHYGFPATDKFRYNRLRNARKGPLFLKLHGSLNWVSCTVCKTIWMNDRYARSMHGHPCLRTNCSGKLRLMLVPPVWNKEPAAAQLNILWRTADDLLRWAEAIEVIGFSFPPTDHLALSLVKDAVGRNGNLTVSVHNGPNFDYRGLETRLAHGLSKTGDTFEDFVFS